MKRILICLVLLFVQARAQLVIDLSTGVNSSGQLLPVNSAVPYNSVDDTWTWSYNWAYTLYSIPTSYQSLAVTNGGINSTICIPLPAQPTYPESRWISPKVEASGKMIDALTGYHFFKATFNLCLGGGNGACAYAGIPFKSAVITFHRAQLFGFSQVLFFNGYQHTFSSGGTNIVIHIQTTELAQQNEILIPLLVSGCTVPMDYGGPAYSPVGMDLHADITLSSFSLEDNYGVEKTDFCIGEEILLSGEVPGATDYTIELSELVNGVPQPIATKVMLGAPAVVNISNIFRDYTSTPYTFYPGTYRVKITVNSSCGQQVTVKDFTFYCCDVDASFQLSTPNHGQNLQGQSPYDGTHKWDVYKTPSINGGPYTPIAASLPGKTFQLDNTSACYYVKHTLTTACGSACTGKRFCTSDCRQKTCNLDRKPENLQITPSGYTISWNAVGGASQYIVEIAQGSNRCCGQNEANATPTTYTVNDTFFTPNFSIPPGFPGFPGFPDVEICFSIRVWAVCPDGSLSLPSDYICSNGQTPAYREIAGNEQKVKITEVQLFPNPSRGMVTIRVMQENGSACDISIIDATGRSIKAFESLKALDGAMQVNWDATSCGKGIYLVKVRTADEKLHLKKLIIE